MPALKLSIQEDMKNAMRAQDKERLGAIRLILAAIKQREVDERIEMDDQQVLLILEKMLKQRRDSITQFKAANRQDLVEKEEFEVSIIQHYMPAALSEAEIEQLIKAAIASTGAKTMQDMGKLMAELKPQLQGRADMAQVSKQIKELLQ